LLADKEGLHTFDWQGTYAGCSSSCGSGDLSAVFGSCSGSSCRKSLFRQQRFMESVARWIVFALFIARAEDGEIPHYLLCSTPAQISPLQADMHLCVAGHIDAAGQHTGRLH
jgi:hypothetical protein